MEPAGHPLAHPRQEGDPQDPPGDPLETRGTCNRDPQGGVAILSAASNKVSPQGARNPQRFTCTRSGGTRNPQEPARLRATKFTARSPSLAVEPHRWVCIDGVLAI